MRGSTTGQLYHRIHDDPLVSLVVALLAYALGRMMVAVLPPVSPFKLWLWISLGVLGVAVALAAYRRQPGLLSGILLNAGGLAGVVVGLGRALQMAVEQPSSLFTLPALSCYLAAGVGALALYTASIRRGDAVVPPNKSLERTREG
jgi:hypothetical protein